MLLFYWCGFDGLVDADVSSLRDSAPLSCLLTQDLRPFDSALSRSPFPAKNAREMGHPAPYFLSCDLVLALEAVAAFAIYGHGFGYFQKCAGGVREVRIFAVD